MKKVYYLLLSYILLVNAAFSQTITIDNPNFKWRTCIDSLYQLPVIITGKFDGNNKFTVQLRERDATSILREIPAVLSNNNLQFTFRDSTLYRNPRVQMKVISSSPKVESAWSDHDLSVFSKGRINISSAAFNDTLNLYDNTKIRLSGVSTSDFQVTLMDSTFLTFSSYRPGFSFVQNLPVNEDKTFSIVRATNYCGPMEITGQYRPVVNSTSIKVISVNPQPACENGYIKIGFSTSGPPLSTNTKYRVRFSDVNSNDLKPNSIDVPAELIDNYLRAKFPTSFNISRTEDFTAQVITENPSLVSSLSSWFTVYPKPDAIFTTESQTIKMGDELSLYITFSGLPPFTAELSDGSIISNDSPGPVSRTVQPLKNTLYSIKSFSSACQNTESVVNQNVQINVAEGIRIEEQVSPQTICAGSKGRIKFVNNATLTAATRFFVKGWTEYNGETITFPATRSGDYVEFDLPDRKEGYPGFRFQIVTTNPALESQFSNSIRVQSMPSIEYRDYNLTEFETPSSVRLWYILKGGAPYKLEYTDGSSVNLDSNGEYFLELYLKESKKFTLKSLSNSCFKNENLPEIQLTVKPSGNPALFLEPVKKAVCDQDSIEITFGKLGTFNPGNTFNIQVYANCCDYQTVKTVTKDGSYKFKLAADDYYHANASIRIASTDPLTFSNAQTFIIEPPLKQFALFPEGTSEKPSLFYQTQPIDVLRFQAQSGPFASVNYTENGVEKIFTNNDSYTVEIPISPKTGQVNEYVIKSATNSCGVVPVNLSTFVKMVPYRIEVIYSGYERYFCLNSAISIPFAITRGQQGAAKFSLQLSQGDNSQPITLASEQTGSVLNATIPATIKTGVYNLRIVSSDGIESENTIVKIGTPPTALIEATSSGPVEPWQNVPLKITLTGSAPYTLIFEDNSRQFYGEEEETRTVNPQYGGQYYIKSVTNFCGFGTSSGSVSINVKPTFRSLSEIYTACEGGNLVVNYSLIGDADLSDDYIRFDLINLSSQVITPLDSTKILSGNITLKMPGVFDGNKYRIRVSAKKYGLEYDLNAGFITKPSATIVGNTTINSGESTYLILKTNTDINSQVKYVLSDGSEGNIFGPAGNYVYAKVSPKQTTTYTLKSLSNTCGEGAKSGSATVNVNPASERSVTVTGWSPFNLVICVSDTIEIEYETKGSFSTGNQMHVQLSDTTGSNFVSITTIGNTSPLKAILPADLLTGKQYRIRVNASDPNTASSAYEYPLMASKKARARFASESVIFDNKNNPKIIVLLEGGAPWTYRYGTDLINQNKETFNASDTIELFQASPNQFYKLFSVWNICGQGYIDSPSVIKVETITGTVEETTGIIVAPNPTQEWLTIQFQKQGKKTFTILDNAGRILLTNTSQKMKEVVNIRHLPTGVYILQIDIRGFKKSYKILKE